MRQIYVNRPVADVAASRATGELAQFGTQLQAAIDRVAEVTAQVWSTGDVEGVLAHASAYLEAVGHVVVAWLWLEQLLAAEGKAGDFYDGKRAAGRYFFRYELPKTAPQLDLLASLDRTTLEAQESWF